MRSLLGGILAVFVFSLFVWTVLMTSFVFNGNPLPVPDWGHRVFLVKDKKAHNFIVDILVKYGFREGRTFESGPTIQTLVDDRTVIMHFKEGFDKGDLFGNGISVPVEDPAKESEFLKKIFNLNSYSMEIHDIGKKISNNSSFPPANLVVLPSDAFEGWEWVFRKKNFKMPKPKFIDRRNM